MGAFGGEGGGEQFAGDEEDLGRRREREGFDQMRRGLRGEDGVNVKAGAEGLGEQVGSFEGEGGTGLAAGLCEGSAEQLEARVLLTLYNADRHTGATAVSLPLIVFA